jgi:ubiquinone/menaquinone biosynthesis C-methylase UbiE
MPTSSQLAVAHWNKTPLYISEEERYSIYPWLYESAEFKQHMGHKVLEIGCGTGCDLLQFARHGSHAIGIDITPEHLRLAGQRVGTTAQVLKADATDLPFADNTFDYIYSHGVLHHTEQPSQVVKEMFRVLRTGGRFNVQVYALWSYFTLLRFLQHGRQLKLLIDKIPYTVHIEFYTARRLRRLFAPTNITIEKFHCRPVPVLGQLVGFFLVAKGSKPPLPDL